MRFICSRSSVLTVIAVGATAFAVNGCGGSSGDASTKNTKSENTERTLSNTEQTSSTNVVSYSAGSTGGSGVKPKLDSLGKDSKKSLTAVGGVSTEKNAQQHEKATTQVGGVSKRANNEIQEKTPREGLTGDSDSPKKSAENEENRGGPPDQGLLARQGTVANAVIEAAEDTPSVAWLLGLDVDLTTVTAPFHMCDGLKTLVDGELVTPVGFSPIEWQETQKALLSAINLWLRGSSQKLNYSQLYVDGKVVNSAENAQILDDVAKHYVLKFLKNVDEFENFLVTEELGDDKDLFEIEWIKYKADEDNDELQTVDIGGSSYVVLPKEHILSIIQTAKWCTEKNRLEGMLSDEQNLEFAKFDVPYEILLMEQHGLAKPVVETKKLVLRFYQWIVNYVDQMLARLDELRLGDGVVLNERTGLSVRQRIITGRDANSSFIINRQDLKSELYRAILEITSSLMYSRTRTGNVDPKYRDSNEILSLAIKRETATLGEHTSMSYDDAIGKAFYLFVVERMDADPRKPLEVPKEFFIGSLIKRQFIAIMNKFKDIVVDTAFRMNKEIGQSENMEPPAEEKPGRFGMDNVATRIASFLKHADYLQ